MLLGYCPVFVEDVTQLFDPGVVFFVLCCELLEVLGCETLDFLTLDVLCCETLDVLGCEALDVLTLDVLGCETLDVLGCD